MYAILKNVTNGLSPVCSELQHHIEETGFAMLQHLSEDSNVIGYFLT